MKKKLLIVLSYLLVAVVCIGTTIFVMDYLERTKAGAEDIKISAFSVEDQLTYAEELNLLSSAVNVGPVYDVESAIDAAQQLWNENPMLSQSEDEEVRVFYDFENDCWMVKGTLPKSKPGWVVLGSVPAVIIQKDGQVLALWLD